MRTLRLIVLFVLCTSMSVSAQFSETTITVVNSTSYDDGVSATTIQDKTGPHAAILEDTGTEYLVHITNLNTGVQRTLMTGISTVSSKLYPITVATSLADTDTSTWEFFGIVFPLGMRQQAQVVVLDESGGVLYESQEGCEVASKFFGDDGTVSFQNRGADIINNDAGSLLNLACRVGNTTEFRSVQLPGKYVNCCCDTTTVSNLITSVVLDQESSPEDIWIWADETRYFWDLNLGSVTVFDMKGAEVTGFCTLFSGIGTATHQCAPGAYIALYVSQDGLVKKKQKFIIP